MRAILFFLFCITTLNAEPIIDCLGHPVIEKVKELKFENFPGAFNPSIARYQGKTYLSFRYTPNVEARPWNSYLGFVELDDNLEPIGEPTLLNKRQVRGRMPLTEDARLFVYDDKLFIIYNDARFKHSSRRDMFISEIDLDNLKLKTKKRLTYAPDRHSRPCQKNWSPFTYKNDLLFTYQIQPHQVIYPDLLTGECSAVATTDNESIEWEYGQLRGGTPTLPFEGENLTFFHSSLYGVSENAEEEKWHYFMGAYTFSENSPFEITSMTKLPITHPSFYEANCCEKFVIFPGGYIFDGNNILIAYGKDDCEMWIATLPISKLKESLSEIKPQ